MGYAIVIGGLLLLYFGAKSGSTPGAPGVTAPGGVLATIETALSGAVRGSVKLGNADPNFEPWLKDEIDKLIGPASGAAGFRQADRDLLDKAIRTRRLFAYVTNAPVGGTGSAFSIASGVGRVGSTAIQATELGLSIADTTVKAIPIIGTAVSFVTGILSVFSQHHAQAVAQEQGTLKAAEPQVDQALAAIDQAYKLGQLGSAQVKTYLEELYTQFVSGLAAIAQPTSFDPVSTQQTHHCNAGCTQERQLRGIIDAMELFDY